MDENPQLTIREMKLSDATDACEIVRSSIRDLCFEDHKNDAHELSAWLSNKTPANFLTWAKSDFVEVYIAEMESTSVGVGCLSIDGKILLNYVMPGWRFRGISNGLLNFMEGRLRELGIEQAKLVSTRTAHRFYKNAGWDDARGPQSSNELEMLKNLRKPTPIVT